MSKKRDPLALAKQLLAALNTEQPANDDDTIDEAALRERMRLVADKVRRARNR